MLYENLLLLTVVVFSLYVGGIWIRYGVQPSISNSFYKLPNNLQWLFTIATWGYAVPAIIVGSGLTSNVLAFFAGAAICFVAAAPAFKSEGMVHVVHAIGAILGVVLSQILICFVIGQWWITVGFILLSLPFVLWDKLKKNATWWIEIFAFASIVLSYYLILPE